MTDELLPGRRRIQTFSPKTRAADYWIACAAHEIPDGERRIVEHGARSIGVFNIGGTFYAVANDCPHQGAPLCRGYVEPGDDGNMVITCPYHGWAYDLQSGRGTQPFFGEVESFGVEINTDGDLVIRLK
jgi:nitrite reductase/ring-hydroxylating ferredoxin subunit